MHTNNNLCTNIIYLNILLSQQGNNFVKSLLQKATLSSGTSKEALPTHTVHLHDRIMLGSPVESNVVMGVSALTINCDINC